MADRAFGVIGLGRMGGGVARRLLEAGFDVVVHDRDEAAVAAAVAAGATAAADPADVAARLRPPRVVWIMVPAGEPVDQVVDALGPALEAGDVVIDGGNSFYRDSLRRHDLLRARGIHFLDCGSSGGIEGAERGLCLMIGGDPEPFALAEPLFRAIARPGGYARVGPAGAGHYAKMVHNAIEYAFLEALGEGFELLRSAPYEYDLASLADLWQNGSVIRGWLLELAAAAFRRDPDLAGITGVVGGGDTGNWAIQEAWSRGVPLPGIALAYAMRLRSRQADTFAGKVVSALRWEFGRHATVPTSRG
ncbi:phosphogluconate dehydrogenase (NAD(+)-dependent, decarboxylating) [Caldinitratiruptor microaerophilus]|uniref:6-phosphogluconate dehydrogenase n=1 Tax=Caldinitratiruptor microaerophilus TaxID=671077 RepID=A0AA35CIV1_9FIRM|nr:decarboxylating 6-phosphogluconate dehydrogenase [Caldinitratiruptor microaerophilus]BDG59138.1 6-phosphogluconate dehydrogenase [Caldinitratiruptor microaerophilus]